MAAALWASDPQAALPLIWSDEFEGASLDASRWTARQDCWGGGNSELQCYTASQRNVWVANGLLHLTARAEPVTGVAHPDPDAEAGETVTRDYSSARIDTRGKASFRYGRIEVRARFPEGQGLWPAIWMLPEHDNYGPYPQSGETDIAEAVNLGVSCDGCADRVHAAIHHGPRPGAIATQEGWAAMLDTDAFHVFALEWTPTSMIWSIDGEPFLARAVGSPFDQRFHLILNLAVGGAWAERTGGRGVDVDALPATMIVDWVRV